MYKSVEQSLKMRAEELSRSIENFSSFIEAASQVQCEQINFAKVANDAQLAPRTVIDYFKVLEDTLVGHLLPAFTKTKKRKAMTSAKFYFFDVGVGNILASRENTSHASIEFGKILEHYVFTELRTYLDYKFLDLGLYYWRSINQLKVAFVVLLNNKSAIGIEVKASKHPSPRDYKGLLALDEDITLKRKIAICQTKHKRKTPEGVELYPLQTFLKDLWNGKTV